MSVKFISDREVFDYFKQRIKEELFTHPVITNNVYCNWFADATLTKPDVIFFTKQFSVFSNQFTVAQLHKVINAGTLNEMHDAKEILLNELGVLFKKEDPTYHVHGEAGNTTLETVDPQYVGIEGSVENSTFRFKAAHFEWLLSFAKPLGLEFEDIGKRKHGTPYTLHFCDELIRLYSNENHIVGAGASFAVENWAAAGFWKQLIQGLENFSERQDERLPLAFFTWHDKLESQHASHTWNELKELYFGEERFDEDAFINAGTEMLDGVQAFWTGLQLDRIARHAIAMEAFTHFASPR